MRAPSSRILALTLSPTASALAPGCRKMPMSVEGLPLMRPQVIETTAWGAACLAGLHAGVFTHGDDLAQRWACERVFEPQMSRDQAQAKMAQWEHAVRQTRLN